MEKEELIKLVILTKAHFHATCGSIYMGDDENTKHFKSEFLETVGKLKKALEKLPYYI